MDGGLRVQYPIFTSDAVFWQARRESKIHERCKNIPRYNILNPPIRYIYHSNRRVQNCERLLKTRMRDIQTWVFPRALSKVVWICQTDLLNKSFFFFFFMSQDTQPSLLPLLSHGDVHFHWNQLQSSNHQWSSLLWQGNVKSHVVLLSRYLLLLLLLLYRKLLYYYYYYYYYYHQIYFQINPLDLSFPDSLSGFRSKNSRLPLDFFKKRDAYLFIISVFTQCHNCQVGCVYL